MSSILRVFHRCYATRIPHVAAVARTKSTPLAVRLRRARQVKEAAHPGRHDAALLGATPTEQARFQRLLALGKLADRRGRTPSYEEWLVNLNERRTRIRGIRRRKTADGQVSERIVGQRIYLPNIIFKMVRNHTPAGEPYNPYEATFRIPQSVTKTDIRSYLHSVYGVATTYIRTDNYISPLVRTFPNQPLRRLGRRTYKRAVVGLVEPFYYPMALEEMSEKDRADRVEKIEATYQIERREREGKLQMLEYSQSVSRSMTGKLTGAAATSKWKWRGEPTTNRGKILQLVAKRRAAREAEMENTKKAMLSARAEGKSVFTP